MPGVNTSFSAEDSKAQRGEALGPREDGEPGLRERGSTHVGQGQGAAAAARVGLLVCEPLNAM